MREKSFRKTQPQPVSHPPNKGTNEFVGTQADDAPENKPANDIAMHLHALRLAKGALETVHALGFGIKHGEIRSQAGQRQKSVVGRRRWWIDALAGPSRIGHERGAAGSNGLHDARPRRSLGLDSQPRRGGRRGVVDIGADHLNEIVFGRGEVRSIIKCVGVHDFKAVNTPRNQILYGRVIRQTRKIIAVFGCIAPWDMIDNDEATELMDTPNDLL